MEPFALSQKIEDLCVLLHEAVSKYPKCERHTLARDTLSCAVHAGMHVAKGNKITGMGERLRCMHQADSEIAQLKILLKLALRLSSSGCPYLSIRKYEQLSGLIGEIGKMIGGWIRSATPQQGRG